MSSGESCLNSSDDQPKDLTIKTAKKLKPIPPPLNLTPEEIGKMSPSLLKEFAIAATSPKSPLIMQKHLPFRKRFVRFCLKCFQPDLIYCILTFHFCVVFSLIKCSEKSS